MRHWNRFVQRHENNMPGYVTHTFLISIKQDTTATYITNRTNTVTYTNYNNNKDTYTTTISILFFKKKLQNYIYMAKTFRINYTKNIYTE